MTAPTLRAYRQISLPQRLQALAVAAYGLVFLCLVSVRPGAGIGQAFIVPIVLVALGGTAAAGAVAGVAAGTLYELGLHLEGSGIVSVRAAVHLGTFVVVGVLVGHFAGRARGLLGESLRVLDELLQLARRDPGTGALDAGGLERVVGERIAAGRPFALLVGEVDCGGRGDGCLRRAAAAVLGALPPGTEVARIGPAQVAVVTTGCGARSAAERLERELDATFGWTAFPDEGGDAWTLFRAAHERLCARRLVRGEWAPTPASAGLVDELFRSRA